MIPILVILYWTFINLQWYPLHNSHRFNDFQTVLCQQKEWKSFLFILFNCFSENIYKDGTQLDNETLARGSVIKRGSTGKARAWLTKLPWRAEQLIINTVLLSICFLFYFCFYYHYFNILQNKLGWNCRVMNSGKRTTQGRINPTVSPPVRLGRAGLTIIRHRLQ